MGREETGQVIHRGVGSTLIFGVVNDPQVALL